MPVRPPPAAFLRHREGRSTAHTDCGLSESFPCLMVSAWVGIDAKDKSGRSGAEFLTSEKPR